MRLRINTRRVVYTVLGLAFVLLTVLSTLATRRMRARSHRNACISNLRIIDGAKDTYVHERGVAANAEVSLADLVEYFFTPKHIYCPSAPKDKQAFADCYRLNNCATEPECMIVPDEHSIKWPPKETSEQPAEESNTSCRQQKPTARHEWISNKVEYLKKLESTNTLSVAEYTTVTNSDGAFQYYRISDKGLVVIDTTQWVHFIVHSGHRERDIDLPANEAIGDISLAIDHRGYLYSNNTHLCPFLPIYVQKTVEYELGFPPSRMHIVQDATTTVENVLSYGAATGKSGWHRIVKEAQPDN